MSQKKDQKAYLQKYLAGPSKDKKKKKKKAYKGKGLQIIDDDLDYSKLRALEGDELDIYGEGEDAPQIAGIIDDRPEEVKKAEQYKLTSKWKVINQDDGFNSKIQIQEIQKDVKEQQEENQLIFGKMYSDSEDEKKNDSDASPPRKKTEKQNGSKQTNPKVSQGDSDCSPPRIKKLSPPRNRKHNSDSDNSPPRKREQAKQKDRPRKESRWGHFPKETNHDPLQSKENNHKGINYGRNSDLDQSPPRKCRKDSPNRTYESRSGKTNNDSDNSPPRKSRIRSPDSDVSPPRKNRRKEADSDISPPKKNRRKSADSNNSPPRKNRRKSPDSDISPPRKNRRKSVDSDVSPPRQNKSRFNAHSNRRDSPPPSNKKMEKTLEGKMAGLQDARALRVENDAFRRREEEAFKRLADNVSGRNAQIVSRKSKRNSEERRQKQEKADRQKELDEKYKKWGKGIKQLADQEARVEDYMREAAKPLARYQGDTDLEESLRRVERAEDPMLQYVRERRRERGELAPEKPSYKGNFPPNRFNIRPGYRWDGVDRSNGYEKKYFDSQSKKKAQAEEYHKWSCADL